ncbi:MAG: MBL fold metallo-hydrolase [Verrucomicrobiaceae bacterium]|nr:MBL fold metallo-hydrolase [Verrucomicrobiaceae bacterium]
MSEANEKLDLRCFEGGPLATNGYAFKASGGWVAIDAPQGMADWADGEGIDPQLLILTHQHFDHVQGAAQLVERFDCPIWAFAQYDKGLTLEDFFRGLEGTGFEIAPYSVNRILEPEIEEGLDILGCHMDLKHIPGHSPDSICFVMVGEDIVFGGDVLFCSGIGRTDFPGGDTGLLLNGIREKLFSLDDVTTVFPGHGPSTTIGRERQENPFL